MNNRLSWKKHIPEICAKANQTRQFLQRNLVACKPETKLQYYKTFIRPIVEYWSSGWDPIGNNQLTKQIETVQGKVAQWIKNNWNYDVSSKHIAKELQLQSLLERWKLAGIKLLNSICWEQKFHQTRKNAIHVHSFQNNIWLSKLLQQLFYSIHSETIEFTTTRSREYWVQWYVTTTLVKYLHN